MDVDQVMKLYDFYWFELQILKKQPLLPTSNAQKSNPDEKIQHASQKQDISRIPTIHKRSMSDQLCSSNDEFSCSPDSVLLAPKLQTILSGKDITYEYEDIQQRGHDHLFQAPMESSCKKISTRRKKKTRTTEGGKASKSLSYLEFEELKGLMDLGFVFTKEDKDSSLAKIVPALQRLGKHDEDVESIHAHGDDYHSDEPVIQRPYLSEAWEVLDRRKEENQLKSWRIPALSNEIDMKDNLRWWAHTVAASVRL